MLIIADSRLPEKVLNNLRKKGDTVLLKSKDIVYNSIRGHPDIFMCSTPTGLIIAPKTPQNVIHALLEHKIPFSFGTQSPGKHYPHTVLYNAVVTNHAIIHHREYTDKTITEKNPGSEIIHVPQGYTRCNLIPLSENTFLTSDAGIEKALRPRFRIYRFCPENIILEGQKHGFLGGSTGRWKNTLFFTGRLRSIPQHQKLKQIIKAEGMKYEELYDGPLIDGGGILFIDKS